MAAQGQWNISFTQTQLPPGGGDSVLVADQGTTSTPNGQRGNTPVSSNTQITVPTNPQPVAMRIAVPSSYSGTITIGALVGSVVYGLQISNAAGNGGAPGFVWPLPAGTTSVYINATTPVTLNIVFM